MNQPAQANVPLILGIVGLTVALFAGLAFLLYKLPAEQRAAPHQSETVAFQDQNDPSVGPAGAKVVVREYSDFECPYCRQADPILRAVMAEYQDRVKFIWKDFPLPQHHNARVAATATRCAQAQGAYQAFHDLLFDKQTEWVDDHVHPEQEFVTYARSLGLNLSVFQTCLGKNSVNAQIRADVQEGLDNRVDSTPTFFINQSRYQAMSRSEWKKHLDLALAAATSS